MQNNDFILFAEYFQFYVRDAASDDMPPVHWNPDDESNMVIVSDTVIAVRTVRELDVCVAVEILSQKPNDEDMDEWDHVVECGLELSSGKLTLGNVSDDELSLNSMEVEPGFYGMRIYFGSLDAIDGEGFEGDDSYHLSFWLIDSDDEAPAFSILKQWMPPRGFEAPIDF